VGRAGKESDRKEGATMNEEGWYMDPFDRHEARWMSAGTPTALVRDGGVESQDVPPDEPIPAELEPWGVDPPTDGTDLKRADDAEAKVFDPKKLTDAASIGIDESTGF
jgi:hypothetical protein